MLIGDAYGRYLVAWQDGSDGRYDVYAALIQPEQVVYINYEYDPLYAIICLWKHQRPELILIDGKPSRQSNRRNSNSSLLPKIGGALMLSNGVLPGWGSNEKMMTGKWKFFYYGPK